jgi:hypothetical protein
MKAIEKAWDQAEKPKFSIKSLNKKKFLAYQPNLQR